MNPALLNLLIAMTAIFLPRAAAGQSLLNFRQDSLYGYKDGNGRVVIAPAYEYPAPFQNGYAMIRHDGDIVVVDSAGHVLTRFLNPIGILFSHRVSEGLFAAYDKDSRRFGYRNLLGGWEIPPRFHQVEDFVNGLAAVWEDPDLRRDTLSGCGTPVMHSTWGYIDRAGHYVIQPAYQEPGRREGDRIVFYPLYSEPEAYDLRGRRLE